MHTGVRAAARRIYGQCKELAGFIRLIYARASTRRRRVVRHGVTMAWVYLFFAGLFEVGWAIGLKYTEGFTRLAPSLWTAASMVISLVLLGIALKSLPVGTGYAVWTGIGTVGTAILGVVLFGEPATALRLACIGLIVAGLIGLKLVG